MRKNTTVDELSQKLNKLWMDSGESVKGNKAEELKFKAGEMHEDLHELRKQVLMEKSGKNSLALATQAEKPLTVESIKESIVAAQLIGEKLDEAKMPFVLNRHDDFLAGKISSALEKKLPQMVKAKNADEKKKIASHINLEDIYKRLQHERAQFHSNEFGAKDGAEAIRAGLMGQGIEADLIGRKIDVEKIYWEVEAKEKYFKKELAKKVKEIAKKHKTELLARIKEDKKISSAEKLKENGFFNQLFGFLKK